MSEQLPQIRISWPRSARPTALTEKWRGGAVGAGDGELVVLEPVAAGHERLE
jgi:hypothetical protein